MAYMEEPYNKAADELQEMENAKQELEEALEILDEALMTFDKAAGTKLYDAYYDYKISATEILKDMENIIEDKEEEL